MQIWRAWKLWIAGVLGGLVVVSALVLAAIALIDSRSVALKDAEITAQRLATVIEQSLARTFETYALSIEGTVKVLQSGLADGLTRPIQQAVLFDTAALASGFGSTLVIDESGMITFDSRSEIPRPGNFSDRDYFVAHRFTDAGLFVSAPFISRLDHAWSVAFSRRVVKPDGAFGGVVTGTIKLAALREQFESISSGYRDSTISLFRADGIALVRAPHVEAEIGKNFGHVGVFKHLLIADHGTFDQVAIRDGVTRRYVYGRVGALPLVFSIGLSFDDVLSGWRSKAEILGGLGLSILAAMLSLTIVLKRELARRLDAERQASAAASRFEQLAHNSTDAIVLRDVSGLRRYASPRFYELIGRSPEEVGASSLMAYLHPDYRGVPLMSVRRLLKGEQYVSETLQCIRPDGSSIWLEAVSRLLPRADMLCSEILTSIRDVTSHKIHAEEIEARKNELEILANIDGLTGITNRRAFDVAYRRELARAKTTGLPVSVLMADVDRFKRFNDQLGHAAGDEALKAVARCIQDIARRPPDVVARYGGEEFVLLLPGADLSGARRVAERLREALAGTQLPHPDGGYVTISIGVATCTPTRNELDLIACADQALYAAKAAGRDRVEAFGPQLASPQATCELSSHSNNIC